MGWSTCHVSRPRQPRIWQRSKISPEPSEIQAAPQITPMGIKLRALIPPACTPSTTESDSGRTSAKRSSAWSRIEKCRLSQPSAQLWFKAGTEGTVLSTRPQTAKQAIPSPDFPQCSLKLDIVAGRVVTPCISHDDRILNFVCRW